MTTEVNDTVERYTISGNGPYAFSFRIFDEDDLTVTALDSASLDPVTLTVNSHFTVTGVNDEDGGSITLIGSTATTYAGDTLDIRSNTPLEQPASIKNQGSFAPQVHETAFDRLSRQVQDQQRQIKQSFRYPDNVNLDGRMTTRAAWASRYVYVNEDGEFEPASSIGSTALTQSIIGETLYPRTAAEIAASVTPVNYAYNVGVVERYQTYVDSSTDMATGLQAAINMSPYVVARTLQTRVYACASNLTFPAATGLNLDFQNSTISFTSTGNNLSLALYSGTNYLTGGTIANLNVDVNGSSSTGIVVRTSHVDWKNVVVTLKSAATNSVGWELPGDETNGTGPYYNNFYNCDVQGQGTGQTGWDLTRISPSYRAANHNTWYGGRVGQCATGRKVTGNGNVWYNPASEGCTTAFDFFETQAGKCAQNSVIGGYYENNTTLFNFQSATGSVGNRVWLGYESGTTNITTGSGANAAGNRVYGYTNDPVHELPNYYKETTAFASAPSITFATPGDLAVGTNNSTGHYRRTGDTVFFDIDLNLSGPTFTTASGALRITNLPFTIKSSGTAPSFIVGFKSTGPTFPAGKTMVAGVGVPNTTYMILEFMGSNTATADSAAADFVSGAAMRFSISGSYAV